MNRSDDFADTGDTQPEGPSKSARKREAEALQTLGERLVGLPEAQLRQVPLPEDLAGAIAECRRISAHGGRYRQMQYIGKLMRRIDPQPILDVLARFDSTSAESKRRQHQVGAFDIGRAVRHVGRAVREAEKAGVPVEGEMLPDHHVDRVRVERIADDHEEGRIDEGKEGQRKRGQRGPACGVTHGRLPSWPG